MFTTLKRKYFPIPIKTKRQLGGYTILRRNINTFSSQKRKHKLLITHFDCAKKWVYNSDLIYPKCDIYIYFEQCISMYEPKFFFSLYIYKKYIFLPAQPI